MGCIYSVHASEQCVQTWLQKQPRACPSKGAGVSRIAPHGRWPPEVERKALRLGPGSPRPEQAESGDSSSPLEGPPPPGSLAPGLKHQVSGRAPINAPFRLNWSGVVSTTAKAVSQKWNRQSPKTPAVPPSFLYRPARRRKGSTHDQAQGLYQGFSRTPGFRRVVRTDEPRPCGAGDVPSGCEQGFLALGQP